MKVEELLEIINQIVDEDILLEPTSPLIGGNSIIDSMNLVQICIAVEEKAQEDGFDFDWTSEKAMSTLNSIFRSPKSLNDEYNLQMNQKN